MSDVERIGTARILQGGAAVDRRWSLALLASLGIGSVLSTEVMAQAKAPASKAATSGAKGGPAPHASLVAAAKKCADVGDVCLRHCIRLTKAGDKSLADCLTTVRAMLPVCAAVGRLAAQDAKRLKELAKVCADVCADCEAECRKHEFHHKECKACAEACAVMVSECKKLAA